MIDDNEQHSSVGSNRAATPWTWIVARANGISAPLSAPVAAGGYLLVAAPQKDLPVETTRIGTAANRPALAFDRQGSRVRFRTNVGRGGSTHGWKGAMRTSFVAAHRIASDDDVAFALRDTTANDRHPVRADQTSAVVAMTGENERRQLWATSIGALGSRESYSALIKSADRLYVGGGTRDGRAGFLQILDAAEGKLLATHELPSRVSECGLATADGQLVVCCEGGEVVCFASPNRKPNQ